MFVKKITYIFYLYIKYFFREWEFLSKYDRTIWFGDTDTVFVI